mgnify:CR=1 FL=1|jgi:hypothetical protein
MTRLLILSLLMLVVGCDDRYRYYCQDPKNFSAKRCQKPDCLFTQDCPEYLVAPILEKKVDPTQSPASAIPNN